jgi:hypothetical protein
MKNFNYLLGLLISILVFSCNPNLENKSENILKEIAPPPPVRSSIKFTPPIIKPDEQVGSDDVAEVNSGSGQKQNTASDGKKKIIKDGYISIKTNDIVSSKKVIDTLAKKFNSYYDTEELSNEEREIVYYLKLRIPSENFEKVISALENGKDEIKSKRINSRDITEEYVDIEARLNQKRDYLKRYKELLAKASTVKDIITVEDNIRKLQEEIESKEGRLKYLNDQISYSTLEINLFKVKDYTYQPQQQDKFFERVKTSLSDGWRSFVNLILWIIEIWLYIILTLILVYIVRRVKKKRKNE